MAVYYSDSNGGAEMVATERELNDWLEKLHG